MKNLILRIFQNRILQHILFWCLSYYCLLIFFSPGPPERIDMIYTAAFHLPLVIAVYINLGLLIPILLRKGRYVIYLLSLVALMGVAAGLNIFLFNVVIDYLVPSYFFVAYYNFPELLLFAIIHLGLTTLIKLSRGWFRLLESENQLIRLQNEKSDTELKFLKTQVNPHFLFNSLNSIYSLSLKKDNQAPAAILKLAEVMRYMIYETDGDFVLLENEINYLKNYIALQQLRNGGNVNVTFEIKGDPAQQQVAPFIFIVFVENAFKHGKAFIKIEIEINLNDHLLLLNVTNDKGMLDDPEPFDFKGLGLDNVKKRLELLYPKDHRLLIREETDLYHVQLRIDLLNS
ncbi:sensor histidine kinase [[Flexibacter] sp. ATCC 35208]|uniref:sensor histidine kinase n=1 Tax=[Flexibacter] sp. ATCC 35208 TaxID=1936242 RepID=UPI0015C3FFB3|nr:histidine kinase [[Flexibacter] sp. ATCC 35208]